MRNKIQIINQSEEITNDLVLKCIKEYSDITAENIYKSETYQDFINILGENPDITEYIDNLDQEDNIDLEFRKAVENKLCPFIKNANVPNIGISKNIQQIDTNSLFVGSVLKSYPNSLFNIIDQLSLKFDTEKIFLNQYNIKQEIDWSSLSLTDNRLKKFAFAFSNVSSVKLGSISFIEECAFLNCKNLESVQFSSLGGFNIGIAAFQGCPELITITDNNTNNTISIDNTLGIFAYNKKICTIPKNWVFNNLQQNAFRECGDLELLQQNLSDDIQSIGSYAFFGAFKSTKNNTFTLNKIYNIGQYAFCDSQIKNIYSTSLSTIDSYAFNQSAINVVGSSFITYDQNQDLNEYDIIYYSENNPKYMIKKIPLTSLGVNCFNKSSIKYINLTNVNTLDGGAFGSYGMDISNQQMSINILLSLNKNIKYIGSGCFWGRKFYLDDDNDKQDEYIIEFTNPDLELVNNCFDSSCTVYKTDHKTYIPQAISFKFKHPVKLTGASQFRNCFVKHIEFNENQSYLSGHCFGGSYIIDFRLVKGLKTIYLNTSDSTPLFGLPCLCDLYVDCYPFPTISDEFGNSEKLDYYWSTQYSYRDNVVHYLKIHLVEDYANDNSFLDLFKIFVERHILNFNTSEMFRADWDKDFTYHFYVNKEDSEIEYLKLTLNRANNSITVSCSQELQSIKQSIIDQLKSQYDNTFV